MTKFILSFKVGKDLDEEEGEWKVSEIHPVEWESQSSIFRIPVQLKRGIGHSVA